VGSRLAWIFVGLVAPGFASASDVYKCVDDSAVAYQGVPCSTGQVEARLPRLPDYADPPERDAASAPTASPESTAAAPLPPQEALAGTQPVSQRGFPYRTTIGLGMTDDQVLNTAHWGRPARILRTRESRRWSEQWTYARADGVRRLSFTNGRLTKIEMGGDDTLPLQIAGLAAR
jgi:hypothetical protein